MTIEIRRLTQSDVPSLRAMNALFAHAFADAEAYASRLPTDEYLESVLRKEHVIVLAALAQGAILGGLVAYELDKLEQARSEIYIYDLAVDESHRRRGVATALIEHLRDIAAKRGAWVIYVQADYVDPPAIALYEKLGAREEVLHFDIPVEDKK